MQIVYRKLSELKNYEKNARVHSAEQIETIARSIKDFGFNLPIEIDSESMIISGHGRCLAATLAGLKEVPTIQHSHMTKIAQQAYAIAANKIALNASWDTVMLGEEFMAILADELDPTTTGFTQDEIDDILNPDELFETENDPDEIPQTSPDCRVTKGEVWLLGDHRLMCGDATFVDDVTKLYANYVPKLMVTDPPYGVNYEPGWRDEALPAETKRTGTKIQNDDRADWRDAYTLFPGDVMYVWHDALQTHVVAQNIVDCGFNLISEIIWVKPHFVISRGDYHHQHETCWYAVRDGKKHNWRGKRDQSTVWEVSNLANGINEKVGHATQKPVELIQIAIENNTRANDYVYDPFGGSGTTLIACQQIKRKCLMMELDEKHCDATIRRWEKFTGKQAAIEG